MPKQSSAYLERVPPIVIKPLVAAVIGLNESIVIQQTHYWLQRSTNIREDRMWIYNTYGEWAKQFPFWSESTIGRIFRRLEDKGLILSRQFNAENYDHTKWYTIDYDVLDKTLKQSGKFDDVNLVPSDDVNLVPSTLDKDYQETTQGASAPAPYEVYQEHLSKLAKSSNPTAIVAGMAGALFGEDAVDFGRAGGEVKRVNAAAKCGYREACRRVMEHLYKAAEVVPPPADAWDYIAGIQNNSFVTPIRTRDNVVT